MASSTWRCLSHGRSALVLVLLALAGLSSPPTVSTGAVAAAASGEPNWHVVSVSSLLPSAVCTAAKAASNSSTVSIVHRHGPCSPLPSRGGPPPPSHAEILDRDMARVYSIHQKVAASSTAKGASVPTRQSASVDTNNYIMSIGLGTPARYLSVELDSGSDLSWVQCKPCRECYRQQDPLFDPAHSSTFSTVPCAAKECQELVSSFGACSSNSTCRYEYWYADNSHTNGHLARDTLTLGPSADNKIPNFVFGCGDDDIGTFDRVDGIFGFGRGNLSLSSQAASTYGPGFSYCLPSSPSAAGYLSLGAAAAAPENAQFTAMVTRRDEPSFYYVDLVGIRVAGETLNIPPAVFAPKGTIMDSGTVISSLPPTAYAALRSAFTRAMARYNYTRAPALSILDTCYDFTGHAKNVRIPSVALVFAGGTELSLGPRGVLYVASVAQTCLAFGPIGDDFVGILGNTQQKTFAVLYDVANNRIGFGANGCG